MNSGVSAPTMTQDKGLEPMNKNEVVLHRLSPEAYRAIEKAVGGAAEPFVSSTTTDLQAGQQIGIQRVLKVLRDGFVITP